MSGAASVVAEPPDIVEGVLRLLNSEPSLVAAVPETDHIGIRAATARHDRIRHCAELASRLIERRWLRHGGAIRALDYGCGAGEQVSTIASFLGNRVPVIYSLVEPNTGLLEVARQRLQDTPNRTESIETRLPDSSSSAYDLVLCTRLLDSMGHSEACSAVRVLYHLLNPLGALLLANWCDGSPHRLELESVLGRAARHRTQKDMLDIIDGAGIPLGQSRFDYDPSGRFHIVTVATLASAR